MALGSHPAQGSQFHQVTYRQGLFDTSRYSPDGHNIFYTAAWEGGAPQIYTVAANGTGGHPVGVENARLLSVSKQGVLAVALDPQNLAALLYPGTLARSTSEGAPKPEIENVEAADFTPDGSQIVFSSNRAGKRLNVWRKSLDGSIGIVCDGDVVNLDQKIEQRLRIIGTKHAADPSGLQLRAENDVSLLEDFHVGSAAQSFGFEWRADGERHWIRVDVRDDTGHLALLGNPIYLRAL